MTDVITSQKLSSLNTARFYMSTRAGGLGANGYGMNLSFRVGDDVESVQANRKYFFGKTGIRPERLATPRQCHSANVLSVDQAGEYESCDGLVTAVPELWLAVSVADCVPLILLDPRHRAIGALHAGWRGSAQRIAEAGIRLMAREFGTNPRDLVAFIGPAASVCCYEVGGEVASKFSPDAVVRNNGSYHIDLKKENQRQLLEQGVLEDNVEISHYCTICTPNLFHSYRRDRDRSGRMMAAVGLIA
ncbi:MAG: peptidoglycan editing factor PgeF [Bacteroidota bacterium]